jgi:hypothetical protein
MSHHKKENISQHALGDFSRRGIGICQAPRIRLRCVLKTPEQIRERTCLQTHRKNIYPCGIERIIEFFAQIVSTRNRWNEIPYRIQTSI